MIVPESNLRAPGIAGGGRIRLLLLLLLLCLAAAAIGWFLWVYSQIENYAAHDQARHADAIVVFGAAEYDGRPSPVLRARLDHALVLYREHLAPLIITMGGGGPPNSEGAVGHDYLMAHGVPESQIIAETQSRDTEQSARRLARIARENHLNRIVAVSDSTHLFRIHAVCTSLGLTVYTSPRPQEHPLSAMETMRRLTHEMISYTLWRMHLH